MWNVKKGKSDDLYSVKDLVSLGLFGRDKAYRIMHSPGFPSVRIGKVFFVQKEAFWNWFNSQAVNGGDPNDK